MGDKKQRSGNVSVQAGAAFLAVASLAFAPSPALASGETASSSAPVSAPVRPAAAFATYVVRYVCFVATPTVKRAAGEASLLHPRGVAPLPNSLRELKNGVSFDNGGNADALCDTSSATAFVQHLAAQTPSYTFRLLATGVSDSTVGGGDATVSGASEEQAPLTVALADSVRITPDPAAPGVLLCVTRTGALTRLSPVGNTGASASATVRWTGDARSGVAPGHIYAHAIENLPGGARLVYAYSVVSATPQDTVAAR